MRTMLVDDEPIMLQQFEMECADIPDIEVVGSFRWAEEALACAKAQSVDLAFLDVEMPGMSGLELADELRKIDPNMIIIFISAYDKYIGEAMLQKHADYYLLKPYTAEDVRAVVERAKLLSGRLVKRIFVQTFGRFCVYVDKKPVKFTSPKARELLALLVDRRGKLLNNEEAFSIMWEDKPADHSNKTTYFRTLRKLRSTLEEAGIGDILISAGNAHRLDTDQFDCDYYWYLKGDKRGTEQYDGSYMVEYSWGEAVTAELNGSGRFAAGDEIY